MAPLIVLIVVTGLARVAGSFGVASLRDLAACARVGLAAMFVFTAVAHFNSMRPDMIAMVPPWVPNAPLMVTLTGIAEVLGAIGLLVPRTRRIAAAALIVFLLAVLPANIHAATAGVTLRGAPATPLVPRILLQAFFIAVVWWAGFRDSAPRAEAVLPPATDRGVV
jgi:uncharacterized membrane protein